MGRGRLALPAVAAVALLVLTSTPARGGSATTFQDAFTGRAGSLATARTWTYETGGRWGGGRELQQYTRRAANAALTGRGTLLITARGETYRGADGVTRAYTSARLVSRQAVRYGTVAARIRTSGTHGAWPAFWTLGSNYPQVGWPACGELDVMESYGDLSRLYGTVHGPAKGATAGWARHKVVAPTGGLIGWHVYAATWNRDGITFRVDGKPYLSVQRRTLAANHRWAMDSPQNLVLDIAVGSAAGTPAPPARFHATMEVDWVRVTAS